LTSHERPFDGSADDLAARLISAGAREMPSSRSVHQTLAALGLGAATLGASASAGAAAVASTSVGTVASAGAMASVSALGAGNAGASVGILALVKAACAGMLAGLVCVSAAEMLTRSPDTVRQLTAQPAEGGQRAREAAVTPVSPAPPATLAGLELPSSSRAPTPVSQPSRSARTDADVAASLAPELLFVDRGRSAFQRRAFAEAVTLLEGYEQRFQNARFLPEVLYLRLQALNRGGEAARAAELARRLLREFPNHAHAASARTILDAARAR
jgi:hypothetical protein